MLEKCYPLIGKVVVEFQQLEFSLEHLILELLIHKDHKDRDLINADLNALLALTASLPFSKKVDVLRSIAPFKLRYQHIHDSLGDVIVSITKAEENRNRIVHGTWMYYGEKQVAYMKTQTSRKHGLRGGGLKRFTTADLDKAIAEIQDAKDKVIQLGSELTRCGVIKTSMFTNTNPP